MSRGSPGKAGLLIAAGLCLGIGMASTASAAGVTGPGSLSAGGVEQPPSPTTPTATGKLAKWERYSEMMTRRESISAYGPDLFGDAVNLENGELSFSATDVSLPGNSSLPVEFRRTYTVRNRSGLATAVGGLHDWTIDVPHISATMATTWPNERCSGIRETRPPPVTVLAPGNPFPIQVIYESDDIWSGIQANMPAGGRLLVWNGSAGAPPAPAWPNRSVQWTTEGRTMVSCLSSIQNAPGEGFLATTADGTTYRFDRMARYTETPLGTHQAWDRVERVKVVLYATLVTDRFGNWVRYHFSNSRPNQPGRLTRIEGSDGRNLYIT